MRATPPGLAGTIAAIAMFLPAAASADYASDLAKAKEEARLALKASDVEIIALHIHRAGNCLYGRDSYFYEKGADPSCDTRTGAIGAATGKIQRRHLTDAGIAMLAAAHRTDVQRTHDIIEDAIRLMESADKGE